ncbi:hypothetical protein E1B28_012878 [Marasmius oreades]|uniref:Uncharacterized protein n=1 Tax=Marasmius oreades TaxID=181124 RepID=A0A9P7RTU4_9AGAR|nr:uncharacterized protein E1B28_012878 [Marasmius oreades]KAG7088933.1 hypothetical protein E1B28_012878 [Marasmius oreades]
MNDDHDPQNLPLRTHQGLLAQAVEVQSARTDAEADRLSQRYGIKQVPGLSFVDSLIFPTSFPYDFMHLIWENLLPNLILHWTGEFKGLDEGSESYTIDLAVWKAIGKETVATGSTIPSAYSARIPDISRDRSYMLAEMRSFWTLYLGPVLLHNHLSPRYFRHFISLVKLLNI